MWLDHLQQDVRGAARSVVKYPVAALVAVVSLAFGIGAMTTTLMVRDVVFRKPPALYRSPQQLSLVVLGRPDRSGLYPYDASCPGPLFNAWSAAAPPELQVAAAAPARVREVRLADRVESIQVRPVTSNLFDLLGVGTAVGRTFADAATPNGTTPAVLSARLWQRLFDERPDAIGRPIWIDGEPYVVAGVLPPGFWFAEMNAPIWIPIDRSHLTADDRLLVVARRPADVTPAALAAQLTPALDAYLASRPPAERQRRLVTRGVEGTPMGSQMALLLPYVLGASVTLTLVIACANVAILMIAQWTAREHEIAIRASLGAERSRIVRALLTESVLLASAGGSLGVAVTFALRGILVHSVRGGDGSYFNLAVDPRILLQSAAITLASGIAAGIVPALFETRRMHTNPLNTLAASDRVRQRWRHALVVLEITVTIALLVETGGMINGYQRALAAEMGFDRHPLLDMQVEHRAGIPVTHLLETLARLPGVAAAAASTAVPFMGSSAGQRVAAEGRATADVAADRISTSPGLFAALGVPLVQGRDFTPADSPASRVAVVNEALARQLFPGGVALGGRVAAGGTVLDIVGVAADYAHHQFQERHLAPKLYVPLANDPGATKQLRIVVRAQADPAPLIRTLRRELPSEIAGLTVGSAFTYDEISSISAQEILVGTAPLVPLIAIGLLLTTAGIYGVLAFAIARRSRELAVRVAIGATGRDLVRLVTAHSARLILIGTTCGIGLTFALSRIVRASGGAGGIYDPDWPSFVAPVLVIAAIGAAATWIPSRRAMRVDPAAVLRTS